jgi:hypothetical protein
MINHHPDNIYTLDWTQLMAPSDASGGSLEEVFGRLQNGCSASFLVEGGFDSHAPPPPNVISKTARPFSFCASPARVYGHSYRAVFRDLLPKHQSGQNMRSTCSRRPESSSKLSQAARFELASAIAAYVLRLGQSRPYYGKRAVGSSLSSSTQNTPTARREQGVWCDNSRRSVLGGTAVPGDLDEGITELAY